jgi:hypothetical protein
MILKGPLETTIRCEAERHYLKWPLQKFLHLILLKLGGPDLIIFKFSYVKILLILFYYLQLLIAYLNIFLSYLGSECFIHLFSLH